MKIYFLGSVSALDKSGKDYKLIVENLKGLGHTVISDHVLGIKPSRVTGLSQEERKEYYRQMQKSIHSADCMVAEISNPTPNVGYEVAFALEQEKPVLALYREDSKVFPLLLGNSSDKLILSEYTEERIKPVLAKGMRQVKNKSDIRFNFFISPEIARYLDWLNKYKRIPRSVYLRDLIEKEMEENTEYKEFKAS